jgi:hypothetical protein
MRRAALLTALLVSLVVPAVAASKEIQSVTACGAGDCATSKNAGLLAAMIDVGPPTDAPKAPAPFYRLRMAIGDGQQVFDHFQMRWVPTADRLLAEDGSWLAARPEVRRSLDRLTRGLAALPATELPGFPTAATSPQPTAPVTSDGGAPVVPVLAAVLLLALVAVLVRRYVVGSGTGERMRLT